jgi:hypothetical protein
VSWRQHRFIAGDQALGEAEMRPPKLFRARHPAVIGIVIESEEMQQTVQHQEADFVQTAMTKFAGLRFGALD